MLGAEAFGNMFDRDVRDGEVVINAFAVIGRIAQTAEGKSSRRIITRKVCFAGVYDVNPVIRFAEPEFLVGRVM